MILIKPYLGCVLGCDYCYQADLREQNNPHTEMNYDLNAMFETMEELYKEEKHSISLHGGEPLALPIEDIEAILKKSFELHGRSAIQTNGWLINDEIIQLFKRYKTGVGISIDGFYPENQLRGFPGDKKKTKEYTNQTLDNIKLLCEENIIPGIIIVLHRVNAIEKHLENLKKFVSWLSELGVKSGRFNPCSVDNPEKAPRIELTNKELYNAWRELADSTLSDGLKWTPFTSMIKNLRGDYLGDCIFLKCDFWNTRSAKEILGDGSVSSCGRTCNQVGSTFIQSGTPTFERYEVLEKTDCKGCRYYPICNGGCPSRGKGGDWRNKDRFCEAIYGLYEYLEKRIKVFDPDAILVTDKNYKQKASSHTGTGAAHRDAAHGDWANHGDSSHNDQSPHTGTNIAHDDAAHQDAAHGDWANHGDSGHGDHGDHQDA